MDRKLSEEEMRVINNVVDKVVDEKIANVINKLLIEIDKLEKRISNFEKDNQTIYQELNFIFQKVRRYNLMKIFIFCGRLRRILNGLMTWRTLRKYV